MNEMPHHMTIL